MKIVKKRGLEFEQLASYRLRTLGFEPTQEIRKVGDGGIDFEGVLDVIENTSKNHFFNKSKYSLSNHFNLF